MLDFGALRGGLSAGHPANLRAARASPCFRYADNAPLCFAAPCTVHATRDCCRLISRPFASNFDVPQIQTVLHTAQSTVADVFGAAHALDGAVACGASVKSLSDLLSKLHATAPDVARLTELPKLLQDEGAFLLLVCWLQ